MKFKPILFSILLISLTFSIIGTGCHYILGLRRPLINSDKETSKLIPVLKKDVPLIIDKLEILRLSLQKDENILRIALNEDTRQIEILYEYHPKGSYFSEKLEDISEEFTAEQINALNYLFFSDELQINVLYIKDSSFIGFGFHSQFHAIFAISDSRWYSLGIIYFDPDNPKDIEVLKYLRRYGDHVEELEKNYYLVRWFRERA